MINTVKFDSTPRPNRRGAFLTIGLACLSAVAPATAQIATDGSIGARQSFTGSNVTIAPGAGATRGGNVFHSFSDFNVNRGQTVTFAGPPSTKNVLARVTGTNSTLINGPLLNRAGRSRLYVINPNGITIGEGARLDSPGGVVLTGASGVRFADGAFFDTISDAAPVLTAADPRSFGFLSAPVDFDGVDLRLPADSSLAVVASGISVSDSVVRVRRGAVSLTAVEDASQFSITPQGSVRADVNYRDLTGPDGPPGGRLAVSGSTFDLSGDPGGLAYFTAGGVLSLTDTQITSQITGMRSGGAIEFITPGTFELDNTTVTASTTGRARSGGILVRSGVTRMGGGSTFVAQSGTEGVPPNPASPIGPAGDIDIEGDVLRLTDGATLTAGSFGGGPVGQIRVRMAEEFSVAGGNGLASGVYAINAGGNARERGLIKLAAPTMTLSDAAQITTAARTDGGSAAIAIDAAALTLGGQGTSIASDNFGAGRGGPITINAGSLAMTDLAEISSRTQADGPAGGVLVTAKGPIAMSSGALIAVDTAAGGNAGRINVTGSTISLDGNARVSAVTFGTGDGGSIRLRAARGPLTFTAGGRVSTDTLGLGKGGEILLRAPQINLSGVGVMGGSALGRASGVYSRSLGLEGASAAGGAIDIQAGFLQLADGAVINASTTSDSPGGTVLLNVGEKVLIDGGPTRTSEISAITSGSARTATGGNIVTHASVRPDLVLQNGGRVNVSSSGGGDAGNIELRLRSLTMDDAGSIASRAIDRGGAGRIVVTAGQSIAMTGGAQITAGSNTGPGGNIELTAVNFDAVASTIDVGTRGRDPGGIGIHASESLRLTDSTVRADGVRAVGRLTLDNARVVLDNSRLITRSDERSVAVPGNGDIDVTGNLVLASSDTIVQSVGAITVTGLPDTDIAASLIVYVPTLGDAAKILEADCVNRAAVDVSSFRFEPRGGLAGAE